MNVDQLADWLGEQHAADFRAARLLWRLACERVANARKDQLRDLVNHLLHFHSGTIPPGVLVNYLVQFGFHATMEDDGIWWVYDEVTDRSFTFDDEVATSILT